MFNAGTPYFDIFRTQHFKSYKKPTVLHHKTCPKCSRNLVNIYYSNQLEEYICKNDVRAAQMRLAFPTDFKELIKASNGSIGKAPEYLDEDNAKHYSEYALNGICRNIYCGCNETVHKSFKYVITANH